MVTDHQLLETRLLPPVGALSTEVEAPQPRQALGLAAGDVIEDVLQARGELVVHQVPEVTFQQLHHGEGQEGRHQRRALLEHVAAVLDGADDGRVGGGATDLPLLQLLDQGGLGVARRRPGAVPLGLQALRLDRVLLAQGGQAALTVVQVGGRVVGTLDVGLEEPVEGDDLAARAELGDLTVGGGALDADGDGLTDGVLHLGGDGALPDELVEAELGPRQAGLGGDAEGVARRPDGLVGLLGVLDLLGVNTRLLRQVVAAVEASHLVAGGLDRTVRQRGAVGTHVGDVAVLVQPLGDLHGLLRGQVEFAGGLLLEGGGAERRVRRAAVGLALHRGDREAGSGEAFGQTAGGGLVEVTHVPVGTDRTLRGEVSAGGHALAVDRQQRGREGGGGVGDRSGGVEDRLDVPVLGGGEGHPLTFALDHQSGRDGLHPARREPGHDLLPQHGRDLVAVETVQDATRLLGTDQTGVEVSRVVRRVLDGVLGDLVEDHPSDGDLGLELLAQVPGDGLALAVLISGE